MSRLILANRYFHPDESATSQFATDLARHLAEARRVEVLASRQRLEDPAARLPSSGTLDGVHIHRLWSTAFGRAGLAGRAIDYASFLAAVGFWLLLYARRGDTIVAKTDPPLLGVVATLATVGRGVRRVQWLQDLYPETAARLGVAAEGNWAMRAIRALRDWSLRRSARVVVVSPGMLAHLRGCAGDTPIAHIPNWSDDFGEPDAVPRAADLLTIGYAGNLGRAHGVEGLLQLAELATDPGLRFLVSGGGAHYQRLRDRVQDLGRANWTFLPYQPRAHLGELLRRSDLHLVTVDPRAERCIFPSKVYGILSAGRPVLHLGDPAGEVATLIREHCCGWSLPGDSGPEILRLLQRLRADPAAIREAGRNARLAYERHFTRSRALQAWEGSLAAAAAQTV